MDQRNIYGQPTPMQGPWFSRGADLGRPVEPIPVEPAVAAASSQPVEVVPLPVFADQVPDIPKTIAAEQPTVIVPPEQPMSSVCTPDPMPYRTPAPVPMEPACAGPVCEQASMEQKWSEQVADLNEDIRPGPPVTEDLPQESTPTCDEVNADLQVPSEEEVPEEPALVQTEPPKSAGPRKNRGKRFLRGLAAVLAVLILVIGSSVGTAMVLDARFQKEIREMEDRIDELDLGAAADSTVNQGVVKPSNGANNHNNNTSVGNTPVQVPDGQLLTPAQVYQMNLDSVVMIYNEIKGDRFTGDALYTGTGFVISEDGYVVTNHHVVEGDGELRVVTPSGQEYEAKLIGSNNANDVALLKVDGEGMQKVTLGDSDSLIVGDQVVAIGNPLGELTSTLTVGYISAKERDVNTSGFAINMLQTDAAINSGNSGGPLFNMRGEVIGITTAKYSGSSGSGASIEGIGFAIPINDVWDLIEDLMENGRETGPYLGVSVSDTESGVGVNVIEVVEGHCCYKAGLEENDVILELDSREVNSVNELSRVLRSLEPGREVEMLILRGDKEMTLRVVLDEKPAEE